MALQFFAGGGIGLLLGLLVGLSSSPVVATVVGAVSGGLLILLGLTSPAKATSPASDPAMAWRLAGFGLVCSLSLVTGVWIRANNLLTPPIGKQIRHLTDAGFSDDDARAWVAYTNSGLLIGRKPAAPKKGSEGGAGIASSVLFSSDGKVDACSLLTAERYKNQGEQINAIQLEGGVWASYASYVARLDQPERDAALGSAKTLFCH